ncbi:response regulator [Leptolinea tardivitalis]|uniref:response regulator n=1 Tax=Leptolinea tardivitalis TaxID=229920 RepID=UPI000785C4E4|nr:response regulator [Leptolinea tardivitalis]GAP19915.1 response regulator consisting of a CheY-like receiver domain and a winged-helix DNA-binding domain [Leptolinea tardivitalis]
MAEKILIVDDDLETLRLVGLILERGGFQIVAASNGQQALTLAHSERPNLIILDIMMPDMDGYQVMKNIRQDTAISTIPVLMFTAKAGIEDKITGYETGVDDYLTKPIHPAELVAHVKAVLSRAASKAKTVQSDCTVMGFMASRGGLGVSTLVLNLAISIYNKTQKFTAAVETIPGYGSWAWELGHSDSEGLNKIITTTPENINRNLVKNELILTTYGIHLLMASPKLKDQETSANVAQLDALLRELTDMSEYLLLDIGSPCNPNWRRILGICNEAVLVVDPDPTTMRRTKAMMQEMDSLGFGKSRKVTVVAVNRARSDIQLTLPQMQEALGVPIALLMPPAPELAYQAATRSVPLSVLQPESLLSQQFVRLAETILAKK